MQKQCVVLLKNCCPYTVTILRAETDLYITLYRVFNCVRLTNIELYIIFILSLTIILIQHHVAVSGKFLTIRSDCQFRYIKIELLNQVSLKVFLRVWSRALCAHYVISPFPVKYQAHYRIKSILG